MSEQLVDVKHHSLCWLSATKMLRLVSVIWVGLSFVVIHYYDIGQVGDSMQWKDGLSNRPSCELFKLLLACARYLQANRLHRSLG